MRIAILIEDNYQVLEVWYPYYRLREEGIETILVGTGKDEYKSKEGYPARAQESIQGMKTDDFSGVIIPGGYAPDMLRRYKEVSVLVKEMFDSGRLVAAICHAGWVLASAGILKGREVTCFSAIKDDVINAGASYLDQEVVVDGNLITSRKPDDLPAFCGKIIGFLKNAE